MLQPNCSRSVSDITMPSCINLNHSNTLYEGYVLLLVNLSLTVVHVLKVCF